MVKAEIIASLSSLKPDELDEVLIAINEMRDGDWPDPTLTDADKAALQEALDEMERNPNGGIPWETFKAELDAKFGR